MFSTIFILQAVLPPGPRPTPPKDSQCPAHQTRQHPAAFVLAPRSVDRVVDSFLVTKIEPALPSPSSKQPLPLHFSASRKIEQLVDESAAAKVLKPSRGGSERQSDRK